MIGKLKNHLHQMVQAGVKGHLDYTLQKRIILSNQISYMLIILIVFVMLIRMWFLHIYLIAWWGLLEILLLLLVPFLNRKKKFSLAHTLLALLPPVIVLFEAPLIKVLHHKPLPIAYHFLPRFLPIAFLLLPMTLIDITKKWQYWSVILLHIACLMLFDPVHIWLGVEYNKAVFTLDNMPAMNLMILITLVFLVIIFQSIQSINHKYSLKNTLLEDKNAEQQATLKTTRQELKKNVILYQILTENSSDLIERFDRNRQVTYTSPSIERILGYTLQERKLITLESITHPEDAKWLYNQMAENTVNQKKYSTYVFRTRHKAGHYIWAEVVANTFYDENGEYDGSITSARDITERKEAEQKLQVNEERFRLAQNFANIGTWEWNIQTDQMIWSTQAYYLMGFYDEVATPSFDNFIEAIHPEDRTRVQTSMQESTSEGKKHEVEYRVVWQNGLVHWVKCQGDVQYNEEGQVTKMIGVIQDVNQRKIDGENLQSSYKSLADFKMALDESTIVAIVNTQGNITYANENFSKISGYATNELIGRNYDVLIPKKKIKEGVLDIIQAGNIWQGEINNYHKNGEDYWLKTTIVPFVNEESKPLQYMVICMDITDRKKAEDTIKIQYLQIDLQNQELQATNEELRQTNEVLSSTMEQLRESEQRLSLATQSAKLGVWDWDIVNNHLVWDDQMFQLYGRKPEGFGSAYEAWEASLHPDDVEKARADLALACQGQGHYNAQFRVRHLNGTIHYIKAFAKVIFDSEHKAMRMIGINWDVTHEKEAEEELTNQKRVLEQILDTLPINIYIKDNEGRLVFLNKETCDTYRISTDYLGKTDTDIFPEEIAQRFAKDDLKVVKGVKMESWEEHIRWRHLDINLLVGKRLISFEKNKPPYILGYSVDITARKRFEQELIQAKRKAEEAAIAKEQFLSTMSHEIRTPMNAVIGMTHVLLENDPRDDQLENLKILKFSAQTLLSLINDILDFNKIDAGKVEFEDAIFELPELMESIQKSFAFTAQEKGIELRFFTDDDIPTKVVGDPVRLTQVLTNLMNNAIKFTHQGNVKVALHLVNETHKDIMVRFTVKDTGVGIPKGKQKIIFERFTQANPETIRKFGGTGLGLAIVKRLLELQDSKIFLESEENRGAKFYFDLKLKKHMPILNKDYHAVNKDTIQKTKGQKILLVEDTKINQLVVAKFLKTWHLKIEYAVNGLEAIEQAQKNVYDLILMDLQMPEMDGYEATRGIRLMPKHKDTPIIALTASALVEERERAFKAGVTDYLTKPFSPNELYNKIIRYIQINGESSELP